MRNLLLASVAVGALLTAIASSQAQTQPPAAPCDAVSIVSGVVTVTCTGNVSTGILLNAPATYSTLYVNALTADITPAAGVAGIDFKLGTGATQDLTINSDTGSHVIHATTGMGIRAHGINSTGDVSVTSKGHITSDGNDGIYATGQDVVDVNSTGNISAGSYGIVAGGAFTTVTSVGDITSNVHDGIHAGGSTVVVDSTGNITAGSRGIVVGGDYATVTNVGDITARNEGISADGSDDVIIQSTGNLTSAVSAGIRAVSLYSDVTVTSIGDVAAGRSWDGILARGSIGAVSVTTSGGTIRAGTGTDFGRYGDGIYAYTKGTSDAGVTIDNSADVYADIGNGLSGRVTGVIRDPSFVKQDVVITNDGSVTAARSGILARICGRGDNPRKDDCDNLPDQMYGNNVTIVNKLHGNIDAQQFGISTITLGNIGTTSITNDGTVTAESNAIDVFEVTGLAASSVDVDNRGSLTSHSGRGISILSSTGLSYSGSVAVRNSGDITSGSSSEGIKAYSISSGSVTVTSSGTIDAGATGIYAFSYLAGDVSVKQTGGQITSATAAGIMAGSQGDIAVELGGVTLGAAGLPSVQVGFTFIPDPDGVLWFIPETILDGLDNTVTVTSAGNLRSFEGVEGLALLGRSGNEAVSNAGTVTGNIDLGSGTNSFANELGGVFNMGTSVQLGAGNTLTSSGTLAAGGSGVVLESAVTGNLLLTDQSLLDFDLGAANTVGGPLNDLLTVSGNLTLDGNLTVAESPGGDFTAGIYRLINYGGSLVDNGLSILGLLPNGLTGTIQTSIAGQVNLIAADGPPADVGYWDGPNVTPGNVPGGRGGTGVWNAALTNWTSASGDLNGTWDSGVGVFGGATGTVTVEGLQAFTGLQFVTGDYHLVAGTGGALDLGSGGFIYVDQGLDASIAVGIGGDGPLLKQGDGRLILTGDNSHAGGTFIQAGTLGAGSNSALGSGSVSISNGAMLQAAAANVVLANAVTVGGAGAVATIDSQAYTFTLGGALSGAGTARKTGDGTLLLTSIGSAIGGLDITAGRLANEGQLTVSGAATMRTETVFANTVLANAEGATISVAGGLTGDDGAQTIDNAGLLHTVIDLGAGNDIYRLHATGTQLGPVDGGAGIDALALNAGPAGRLIGEDDYVNFDDLLLNADDDTSGRFVLAAVTSPAHQATLDLGPQGTASLIHGELGLVEVASSLRTGSLTTWSGTRLTGNGKVTGDVTMQGSIAPGNDAIGQLTIDGDYEQSGSFDVEISHLAAASPGLSLSDRIVTTGEVSFGGKVAVTIADGNSLAAIKAAGAARGAMRWRILDGQTVIAPGQRTAQLAAPAGLALGMDYANGGEDVDLFMAWSAPPKVTEQANQLWQTSLEPDMALCDDTAAYDGHGACAFLQGEALSIDDEAQSNGRSTGWSGIAGAGGRLRDDLWLGAGAGYRSATLTGGDFDRTSAYLWGKWRPGAAELRGFAGFGHLDVDGSRSTTAGSTASWDYGAWQPYLAGEGRYWVNVTKNVALTPLAGLTSVWLSLPGHGESGGGGEDFTTDGTNLWAMTTLLGGEARWQAMPGLAFEASAGWQHLFGDDAVRITGSYDAIPGSELTGTGEAVDRDTAALRVGMLAALTDNATFRLDYDAGLSGNEVSQSGLARVSVSW